MNARNSTLFTPCHFVAQEGHADAIDLIAQLGGNCSLKNGAGAAPVHRACISDHKPAFLALLEAGCDASLCDDDGYIHLHAVQPISIRSTVTGWPYTLSLLHGSFGFFSPL
jgi:ankyrin repeat protein